MNLGPESSPLPFFRMRQPVLLFLTHEEVPANLRGVKVGQRVRLIRDRSVVRVGYRLTVHDAPDLRSVEAKMLDLLAEAMGTRKLGQMARVHARNAARSAWLASEGHGGPDRGVLVDAGGCPIDGVVTGKRTAVIGVRHGGYTNAWDPSDSDGPTLQPSRVVLLMDLGWGEVLSGDVEIVEDAP